MRRGFWRDERAAFDGWAALQIGLLLIIPGGAFVFWWFYLRRIGKDMAARDPMFSMKLQPGATVLPRDQTRVCGRCGLTVKPPRGGGPPTCPNCMSLL